MVNQFSQQLVEILCLLQPSQTVRDTGRDPVKESLLLPSGRRAESRVSRCRAQLEAKLRQAETTAHESIPSPHRMRLQLNRDHRPLPGPQDTLYSGFCYYLSIAEPLNRHLSLFCEGTHTHTYLSTHVKSAANYNLLGKEKLFEAI